MKNLNYLMAQILSWTFKIILSISSEKQEPVTDNISIKIYVIKREIIITCKIKTRYYLEILMPENLLGNTKKR